MKEQLRRNALSQGGAFTHRQALDAGYTRGQIRGLLAREWNDPYRGVYVERSALEGTPEQRHVVLAAARVLTSALGAAASHRTGALVLGLPLLGNPPEVPQLSRPPRRPRDRSSSKSVRVVPLPPGDVVEANGIRATSLPRTACDVARTTSFREGVVVADAVLRRRLPPQTLAYDEQGLPPPETQVEVFSPDGDFLRRVDFLWRAQRVVGEADGLGKYDGALALKKEKMRELGLGACGLEVVRNVWDDVWTESCRRQLGRRVRQAFEVAARQPVVPGVVFRTPSLEELLDPPPERWY